MAAKFFEVSSEMLEYMTFQELGKFAQLINSLSQKSTEVAADCLSWDNRCCRNSAMG